MSFCVILFIAYTSHGQLSTKCLPDKGIKIAKTTSKIDSEENSLEVTHDKKGRVISIKKNTDDFIHKRIYENGRLKFLISIDSYATVDTVHVTKYHLSGEAAEIKNEEGLLQIFNYDDCKEEMNMLISSAGDTIHHYKSIFDKGILIKSIWTPFQPVKSEHITEYYDYKFNEKGHWVERKYKNNNGVVIEKRTLTYHEK